MCRSLRSTTDFRLGKIASSNFLISANSFVQSAGIAALSKEGDEAVEKEAPAQSLV